MSENRQMRIYVNGDSGGIAIYAWKEKMDCDVVSGMYSGNGIAFSSAEAFMINCRLIELCDGIYMARGWEKDSIQVAELSYAKALGKRVYFESRQYNILKSVDKGGSE